ncbi:MAG: nuclear transport factor 2 family protein [Bacteroidota bacterium]
MLRVLHRFALLLVLLSLSVSNAKAQDTEVLDLSLDAETRADVSGLFTVTPPDPGAPTMTLRLFEDGGVLKGTMNGNEPTRMLYQGDYAFRPEAAPAFLITFVPAPDGSMRVTIQSPNGTLEGTRMGDPDSDPSTSGPLFDALAEADHELFTTIFVACDPDAAVAFLDDDVEFYHDKVGASMGEEVHTAIRNQATNCPRARGVTRELLPGSLFVSPIPGFGAVQTGVHRFVEGESVTVARFTHLWRETPDGWRVSRVLSYDHRTETE